ncbi:tyrosine-protein phosphatase non-receptor type 9-like [Cimex lectularius]|uniref:Tyrosine-protein phosphatase non-receptor type 9 n=1 Tax=Cimex lectularius TaxID=79782 RepID=A0A8I6S4F6_CIMLE|nr:tyrosine-protein phosphatase non-receptor type 9-like [Cimex lectularius]
MANNLTPEQRQATKTFLEAVNKLRRKRSGNSAAVSPSTAVKFLSARKFEVSRAITLFEQHELTRQREGLVDLNPQEEPLKSELDSGKFTILPTRDSTGAAIAVFTARIHCPQTSTHQTTLQGLVYQLDVALESVDTQKAGIVFIYDMSDSKYSHFDYDLSQKILTLLKGGYPARLKKVLIVTAPLWFKAPFKILRLFVREKLRDRVFTVSLPQLSLHIPRESLPVALGGGLQVAHHAWLLYCQISMANKTLDYNQSQNNLESYADSPVVSEDEEINSHPNNESWQPITESAASPVAPSSASSGFSDDDSLHCDSPGGQSLIEFVEKVRSKGKAGLSIEYAEIKARPPDGTFNHSKMKQNQAKNRYTDVLCYDHSRVLLSVIDDDPTSDYINANFVDGYKQKNAFISTQGPLHKTCDDFWRMVWEQGTVVIVMTTRVVERARYKCWQYWPPDAGTTQTYGIFTVQTMAVESHADFIVSIISLVNTKTDERRHVEHLQYISWPDYGVPESAAAVLSFLQLVRSTQEKLVNSLGDTWAGHPRGPPVVVHCSAGIGRTGTFCTLDICISRLDETGSVDVRSTVERIRGQRAFSIQMPDQYIFCHLALIEYAVAKGMIPPTDLFVNLQDHDSD